MPKKTRREKTVKYQRRRQTPRTATGDTPAAPAETAPAVTASAKPPARRRTAAGARYPYVAAELRRIGLLAAVTLAVLILLALVLS